MHKSRNDYIHQKTLIYEKNLSNPHNNEEVVDNPFFIVFLVICPYFFFS